MTMVSADHGVASRTNTERAVSSSDPPIRVLIVEDDPAVRNAICCMLEFRGFTVIAAEDGHAGLKLAKDFPGSFDLLLTDIHMPEMKGPEFARRLHLLRPDVAVLYMSANPADAFSACQEDPGADFLAKPFSSSDFMQKINSVLARRSLALPVSAT